MQLHRISKYVHFFIIDLQLFGVEIVKTSALIKEWEANCII